MYFISYYYIQNESLERQLKFEFHNTECRNFNCDTECRYAECCFSFTLYCYVTE